MPAAPTKVAFTLNIKEDRVQEYIDHHAHSRPEVVAALRAVGLRNISLWTWRNRLFYYAEFAGDEPFEDAMRRYAEMDGVKEWEELMHTYQEKLPGCDTAGDVWWMQCTQVYSQQ